MFAKELLAAVDNTVKNVIKMMRPNVQNATSVLLQMMLETVLNAWEDALNVIQTI